MPDLTSSERLARFCENGRNRFGHAPHDSERSGLLRTQVVWDAPAFLVMLNEVKHPGPVGDAASKVDTHLSLQG